ncbi:hypothetical protein YC2023_053950 [Brassica napus]
MFIFLYSNIPSSFSPHDSSFVFYSPFALWSLEELSLRSYDAVEIEPGLLATLGQHLGRLRKPEFSFNELLFDKEVADEVEAFVHKSQCLKKILVEENKITEAAPKWASIDTTHHFTLKITKS